MSVTQYQILAFNAVCRHKGFSKAAKALGVTQSSVTQNVSKFEAAIGARLFERRRAGLVLTPAGSRIYAVTEEIGLLYNLLDERMQEYAKANRGLLRIAADTADMAMTYMKRFTELHPGVDLTFDRASWRRCADMLRNRDADVALMPEPENKSGLYIWPLAQRYHTALVYEGHPFYTRDSVSLTEMVGERIIKASPYSFARWRLESRTSELGIQLDRVMLVGSTMMAIQAVQHKLGIAVTYATESALASGLRGIPIVELSEPYQMVAACNADVRDLTVIRSFFECMD